jgi:chorismate-pyruvate lyase
MRTLARFVAQHERPARLTDVDLAELSPELRVILLHDGTLTTALEVCRLSMVTVDVRRQEHSELDETAARLLAARIGSAAISRSVDIRDGITAELLAEAHSMVIADRLPTEFPDILATCPNGLGEALTRLRLECRRELLWFGRAPAGDIARGYRVICRGRPVLLIEESFPHSGR